MKNKNPNKGRPKWAGPRPEHQYVHGEPSESSAEADAARAESTAAQRPPAAPVPRSEWSEPGEPATALAARVEPPAASASAASDAPASSGEASADAASSVTVVPSSPSATGPVASQDEGGAQAGDTETGPARTAEPYTLPENKTPKRPKGLEPSNSAEALDAFFGGRIHVLSKRLQERLQGCRGVIEPGARGDLLRKAAAVDTGLERARRLMAETCKAELPAAVRRTLLVFCADLVSLNPFVRGAVQRSEMFPEASDGTSFEAFLAAFKATRVVSEASDNAATTPSSTETEAGAEPQPPTQTPAEGAVSKKPARTAKSKPANHAAEARTNAVFCALAWRRALGFIDEAELVSGAREAIVATATKPLPSVAEALGDALLASSESDLQGLNALIEWAIAQRQGLLRQLSREQDTRIQERERADRESGRAQQLDAEVGRLTQELEAERRRREAAENSTGIARTHGQADLDELRAGYLKTLRVTIEQLTDLPVALGRTPPKVDSAVAVIDEVLTSLQKTLKGLKEEE